MAFFDRATGGLITTTLPGVLATFLGYSAGQRGWLIGLPLILMALCTGPAGALCDRVGSLRVRLIAGAGYAVAFGLLPFAASSQPALGAVMVAVGILAGTMFASSLALAAETGRGTVALGAFRAAGDLGFFAGTAVSIAAVAALGGGGDATYADYAWMIAGFAAAHGASTAAIALLARRVS
jgi:MFS family permease